jgi:hypothetical protein
MWLLSMIVWLDSVVSSSTESHCCEPDPLELYGKQESNYATELCATMKTIGHR